MSPAGYECKDFYTIPGMEQNGVIPLALDDIGVYLNCYPRVMQLQMLKQKPYINPVSHLGLLAVYLDFHRNLSYTNQKRHSGECRFVFFASLPFAGIIRIR
jgi:hypothetical protein